MPVDRRFVLASAAALAVPAAPLRRAALAGDIPRIGEPAPPFSVKDLDGRTVTLDQFKGRTVVLEWTHPECPWVAKHYTTGNMQALQTEARSRGVVWLTVSSGAPGNVGFLDELEAAALQEARGARVDHLLLDHTGSMRDAYAIVVALTLAVIGPDGRLAYWGAMDDRPTTKPADVAGAHNYVRAALAAVARGDKPSPSQTRPYGCTSR